MTAAGDETSDDPRPGRAGAGHDPPRDQGAPADATRGSNDETDGDGDHDGRDGGVGSFLRELPVLLAVAFLLAFLLRTFVLQVFFIPSSSMEPTLEIDDRMVVEKVSYYFGDPERGDVVVFEGDEPNGGPPDAGAVTEAVRGVGQFLGVVPASARDLVKRVVGLPGDEIVIEEGQVFVNGEPIDEPYVEFDDASDFGPTTVPEDQLFFLGDNRPNSSDSRRSLGFVPEDRVVGRAVAVIWPPGNLDGLSGVDYDVPEAPSEPDADDEGSNSAS